MKNKLNFLLFFLMLIPVSQIVLFFLLINKMTWQVHEVGFQNDPYSIPVVIVMIIGLLGDILIFFAMDQNQRKKEIEKKLLTNDKMIEKYTILEEEQKQIRQLQHDIDGHISTVKTMLDNGRKKEAICYINKIDERISSVIN